MAWRDELTRVVLPDGRRLIGASFRGVPFFVESAERQGGRRIVPHEFPQRDDPYVEDLGRRARAFPVEGYICGQDYIEQRDKLLTALEDVAGPGELVHPYYGVKRAVCARFSVQESIGDGGIARLSIEFVEAPAQAIAPSEEIDPGAQVEASAAAAEVASTGELEANFDVDDAPSFALESLTAQLEDVAEQLETGLQDITLAGEEAARVAAEIHIFAAEAAALVQTPVEAVETLASGLALIAEAVADAPRPAFQVFVRIGETLEATLNPGTTPIRVQERINSAALSRSLRTAFATAAGRLLLTVEHETLEDAIADRDSVADLLEELAADAGDALYPALVQLRADVLRAVPGNAVLARLVTREVRVALPSLLLTYQLYGSVEQEADILARNRIRHPGVISGEIQVLSDG